MRLKKIKIINFGQLSNLEFDLPSDNLNLFFGKNESGKSTTVAFIKQVMFGFYLRSSSSPFFEDYTPLAHVSPMGGSLFFEDKEGSTFELERLWAKGDKTKRGILTVKKDGQLVPENLFFDQIQNINGEFYADSFIFNQDMLGQVSSLSQADLLERIYYLGAADSSKLLEIRDSFEKNASTLFKKTGKKPEVNRLLKEILDQRENLIQVENQYQDYEELEQEYKSYKKELDENDSKLKKLNDKLHEYQDLQKQLENYQTLKKLEGQQKEVNFDKEDYQNAQSLLAQIKNLAESIDSLQNQLEQLSTSVDMNFTVARELVQKRANVLQWQSEYQACLQKAQQFESEKQQILALNPELSKLIDLNSEQIKQLQNDYDNLPQEVNSEFIEPAENPTKIWTISGIIALVIGFIWAFSSIVPGVAVIVGGIAMLIYGLTQKSKSDQARNELAIQKKKRTEKYQLFTQKYGFDPKRVDLKDLFIQLGQYQLKESAIKTNNDQIADLNLNLQGFTTKVENTLKKQISPDFDSVLNAINVIDNIVDKQRHLNDRKQTLQADLSSQKQKQKELNLELKAIFAKDNLKDMSDFDQQYQESLKQADLKTRIDALKASLKDQLSELEKFNSNSDSEKLAKSKLEGEISDLQKIISDKQAQLAEIQVKMNNLSDSTAVFEARQELANLETKFENASKEYLANLLASKWINRALDIASNERFPKMLAAAKEYFKLLTGGRYTDLALDKKITVIRADGKKRDVKYLSRGTAEQLYFALKLAFVEQIKDKINLPILIDDSFVNFDDQRVEYIEELLKKISENNQVLIFTAQNSLIKQMDILPLTFTKGNLDA